MPSGPLDRSSLAVSELSTWAIPKPRSKPLFDLFLGGVRVFSPEILPHQIHAGLEQIHRDPETIGGTQRWSFFHSPILSFFRTCCPNKRNGELFDPAHRLLPRTRPGAVPCDASALRFRSSCLRSLPRPRRPFCNIRASGYRAESRHCHQHCRPRRLHRRVRGRRQSERARGLQ